MSSRADLTNLIPTLYIGLGGSGRNTLLRFRTALYDEFHSARPKCCRFLVVDSDGQRVHRIDGESDEATKPVRLEPDYGEFINSSVSPAEYDHALRRIELGQDPNFKSWLHPNFRQLIPWQALVDGAGSYRQAGRFQFFISYERIRRQIKRHLSDLRSLAAEGGAEIVPGRMGSLDPTRLEVVIVVGLAGGAGSGMILDMAYLIQDILANGAVPGLGHVTAHVTLIAYLPTVFSRRDHNLSRRFQQNAYAALLEMEQYGTPRQDNAGFKVNWSGNQELVFRQRPWDDCYLIDDVNDREPGRCREAEELYQLGADYLFQDFGNSPFAIAKRSTRPSRSRFLERQVQSTVSGQAEVNGDAEQVELFSNQYGCGFSSFGLAELRIDRERINRAASHRLAVSLVERRWINSRHTFKDRDFQSWTSTDLDEGAPPTAADEPVRFNPNALGRDLFSDDTGVNWPGSADSSGNGNWIDLIRQTIARHSEAADPAALRRMLDLFDSELLGAAGPIRHTLERRCNDLAVKLRRRLATLTRARFKRLGVKPTLELLDEYDRFLGACAGIVVGWPFALQQAPTNSQVLARLEDALSVPLISRSIAVRIEYPRAVARAESALLDRCRHESIPPLKRLYSQLREYVESRQQAGDERLMPLRMSYFRIHELLELILQLLIKLFMYFAAYIGSDRAVSLLPSWSEADYDREVARTLMSNPEIGLDKEGNGPNWERAEAVVLEQLPVGHGESRTLPHLIDHWTDECARNHEFRNVIVERLAQSCRELLGDGIGLEGFAGGNVVNYLASIPPDTRHHLTRKLIDASAPYLPTSHAVHGDQVGPHRRNVLGRANGEGSRDAAAVERFDAEMNNQALAVGHNLSSDRIHVAVDLEPTRVVLLEEMVGFPLSLYARLPALEQAYRDNDFSDLRKTCHINYLESSLDLPDVRFLDNYEYQGIREYVDYVYLGLCLGFIAREDDGMFCARIHDSHMRFGEYIIPLGKRLNRIVRNACSNEAVRIELRRMWEQWRIKIATPRHFAVLYHALQRSHDLVRDAEQHGLPHVVPGQNPVMNSLRRLLTATALDLQKSDEGGRWLDLVREPRIGTDPPEKIAQRQNHGPALFKQIGELCLHLPDETGRVPIFQIHGKRILEIQSFVEDVSPASPQSDVSVAPREG